MKKLSFLLFTFLAGIAFINPAYSQGVITRYPPAGASFECRPEYFNPKAIIGGIEYNCTCSAKQIVCKPASGVQRPSKPGLNLSQQMALGIFGAMLQGVFGGMFDDLAAPPKPSVKDTLKKQQEEEFKKQQEMKKQALVRWLEMQAAAETNRQKEEAEKKAAGEKILAKTSISGEGLKLEPLSGGKLAPFSGSSTQAFTATPSTQYETANFSEMERLLCSAYFSKMAENAAKNGDLEGARFYGNQMDGVIQGLPTALECKAPQELASTVDLKKAAELNKKLTQEAKFYREAMPKIEKLREVERKLEEINAKKEEAGKKIEELETQIAEIKAKGQPNDPPEKKKEADDLLAQAMALKQEAEKQQQEAVEAEEKLLKEKENIEDELTEMKNKMAKGETKQ